MLEETNSSLPSEISQIGEAATPPETASPDAPTEQTDAPADVLPMDEETPLGMAEQVLQYAAGDESAFWRAIKGDLLEYLQDLMQDDAVEYQALRAEIKRTNKKINVTSLDSVVRGESDAAPKKDGTELAALAAEKIEAWHDADGETFASFKGPNGETQHWRIDSTGFRDWLSHLAFSELGTAPGSETLKTVCNALAGRAKFEGEEYTPARRVAKDDAGHWLDIGDAAWRAILLTATGWRVMDQPPVRFLRTKASRPLPDATQPGDVALLWDLVNVPEQDRLLVLAWLLECWRADAPYAVLEISGEQGAAKSTAQRILRTFIDPNEVPLRGRPKTVEDLFVAANNNHLLSFENLSTLSADQSDALCAISTGAGFAARQLYTNGEEALIKAHRPIVLNGINAVITRPDLLDRAICLHLPRLTERKTDAEIAAAVEAAAPRIFAGLLDLFCAALRRLPDVKAEPLNLPRMADFAQLGEAIARELRYPAGHFLRIYAEHRRVSIQRTIDASPVAAAIVKFVDAGRAFNGTVGDLLDLLSKQRPDHEVNDYWPRSARGLGDALRRYSPALAQIGIHVEVESKPRRGGSIHCSVYAARGERFFQGQTLGNDVNNVNRQTAPVDVVDVVDVVSGHSPRKKELTPAENIITGAEIDL